MKTKIKYILIFVFVILLLIFVLTILNQKKNYELFSGISSDKKNIHVYLISLEKNQERRENFKKYYHGKYEYIPAVDGNANKDTHLFKNWGCLKPDNNTGYKALQLSNVKIFKDAIAKKYEWIVIFEDDAEPPENFDKKLLESIEKYSDSKVIYLDNRNASGEGVIPGCCTSCVAYHKSVFKLLLKELNPETSTYMKHYWFKKKKIVKSNDCLFDFFLANTLANYNIKTSSQPIVPSGNFISTISN